MSVFHHLLSTELDLFEQKYVLHKAALIYLAQYLENNNIKQLIE